MKFFASINLLLFISGCFIPTPLSDHPNLTANSDSMVTPHNDQPDPFHPVRTEPVLDAQVPAVYKRLSGQRAARVDNKPIKFFFSGFSNFWPEPQVTVIDQGSNIIFDWLFLAPHNEILERYAKESAPTIQATSDFDALIFRQLTGCYNYSVTVADDITYNVYGMCMTPPTISIPKTFPSQVFVDDKLVHDAVMR